MAKASRIALDVFLGPQILESSFGKITVAGMHGNHPIQYGIKQGNGVIPCKKGVGRVIIDPERWIIDCSDEPLEAFHLLGKFRIGPEIVFIMILQDKCYAMILGYRQTGLDTPGGQSNALFFG